jgi:hypothetical protein
MPPLHVAFVVQTIAGQSTAVLHKPASLPPPSNSVTGESGPPASTIAASLDAASFDAASFAAASLEAASLGAASAASSLKVALLHAEKRRLVNPTIETKRQGIGLKVAEISRDQ